MFSQDDKHQIAVELSKVLASTYTLYLKTQNFHWNVTGPFFQVLHTMFEAQYEELAMANDEIAERIRALGDFAPATYREFIQLSAIAEPTSRPSAEEMVQILVQDHETLIAQMRTLMDMAAEKADEGTNDLLSARMSAHEKTVWMLKSFLAK